MLSRVCVMCRRLVFVTRVTSDTPVRELLVDTDNHLILLNTRSGKLNVGHTTVLPLGSHFQYDTVGTVAKWNRDFLDCSFPVLGSNVQPTPLCNVRCHMQCVVPPPVCSPVVCRRAAPSSHLSKATKYRTPRPAFVLVVVYYICSIFIYTFRPVSYVGHLSQKVAQLTFIVASFKGDLTFNIAFGDGLQQNGSGL